MNSFNKTAACILAAIVMTACNNDDAAVDNQDGAVRFTAQIGKEDDEAGAQARASGIEWTVNDPIGVYAFLNETTTPALEMTNKKYKADATGTFTYFIPEDEANIYFPVNGTQKFDFIAYYPHQNVTNYIYNVDVSTQAAPNEIDLLYAKTADTQTTGYDKHDPDVALVFVHKLTKLTLNTVPGSGLTQSDLNGMTVTIKRMNTAAEFNLETAALSIDATSVADITPLTVEAGKQYKSIILPATSTAEGQWAVEFLVNGNTYIWNVPAMQLKERTEYIWKISVQKIPVLVSGMIIAWIEEKKDDTAW